MIIDEETNYFVNSLIGNSTVWIGAHRVGVDVQIPKNNQWTWIDGSALVYNNWHTVTGEPNNWDGEEFCVTLNNLNNYDLNGWSDGTWNDQVCDTYKVDNYVCQL